MEHKQWLVFTFGADQPNAGKYVRIFGTYGEAREKMFAKYGKKWSFQYSEEEWSEWIDEAKEAGVPVEVLMEEIKGKTRRTCLTINRHRKEW